MRVICPSVRRQSVAYHCPQALQNPNNFGELSETPGFMAKLLASQAVGLEGVMVEIQKVCEDLKQTANRLRSIAKRGHLLIQQEKRLTGPACAKELGPIPSINACRDGLQYIV